MAWPSATSSIGSCWRRPANSYAPSATRLGQGMSTWPRPPGQTSSASKPSTTLRPSTEYAAQRGADGGYGGAMAAGDDLELLARAVHAPSSPYPAIATTCLMPPVLRNSAGASSMRTFSVMRLRTASGNSVMNCSS